MVMFFMRMLLSHIVDIVSITQKHNISRRKKWMWQTICGNEREKSVNTAGKNKFLSKLFEINLLQEEDDHIVR